MCMFIQVNKHFAHEVQCYTNRVYIVITTWSYTLIHSTYCLYDYCVHYGCVCTASKYLGFKDEVNEADSDLALQ